MSYSNVMFFLAEDISFVKQSNMQFQWCHYQCFSTRSSVFSFHL